MPNDDVGSWLKRYYDAMRRFAVRLAGPQDGEDLLHHSCEVALRKDITAEVIISPRRWLNGIIAWTFRGMLSAKKKNRVFLAGDLVSGRSVDGDEFLESHGGSVAASQEAAVDVRKIGLATLQLNPSRRIAFFLTVFRGMTNKEAAAVAGVSNEAIRQSVAHARNDLGTMLSKTYPPSAAPRNQRPRKRAPRSKPPASARINEAQAREIFRRAVAGENQAMLAKEFGIGQSAVSNIKSKKAWKQIHENKP